LAHSLRPSAAKPLKIKNGHAPVFIFGGGESAFFQLFLVSG
jgi:ribosomal protein L25 (general stress protein Ctc)